MNALGLSHLTFDFTHIIIYFTFYSLLGWAVEFVYRSIESRSPINPGFLYGPFLPIYGCAVLIMVAPYYFFRVVPLPLEIGLYAFVTVGVEYVAGYMLERLFGLRLWDYSDERFNLHGRVCLKFSLYWTVGALVLVKFLHPLVDRQVRALPSDLSLSVSLAALAYFSIDASFSVTTLRRFHERLLYLAEHYLALSVDDIQTVTARMKRLLGSFPYLKKQLDMRLRDSLSGRLREFRDELQSFLESKKPVEKEYQAIVKDILNNEEFLKLRNFRHHATSIFDHALAVSYLAYRVCKHIGCNYREAARGALLHDFFLYDWRKDEGRPYENRLHGFAHPGVALDNARKNFTLSRLEEDIILRHMWPLTVVPPRYREAFIVSFIDKYVATKEFARALNPRGRFRAASRSKPGKVD